MSASALPQGFSIFQPVLGAQLQFFPAVGTQELDELIHAHLVGPASSQEKRATLALDFLEHAQLTGQSFKFYPVYAASPAPSAASSSFNTSPATTTWDWSQTSRTASVSSRSSQNRVAKAASPTSRMRTTDFSSLPGMKIMTKDGLDVTNSASRGSKTKEQRDHAHLMRIIKACDSCKRKKIRCDPSHKKRSAPVQGASAAAAAKVTKKARTASPTASQSVSPPQSISPASASPPIIRQEFALTASPFDLDATFSFDALDAFDPALAAPADLWDEFVQFPSMDYDFFADPESYLSSQASDADASASQPSASVSPTHSGAPPERGPDDWFAEALESRVQVAANAPHGSFTPQLPYDSPGSAGEYADFNLFSPGSSFSEDDRMLDISSSTSSLSAIPSPLDSPRPPQSAQSPDIGVTGISVDGAAVEALSPFTRAEEASGVQHASAQLASSQAQSPFTLAEQAGEAELPDACASAADRDAMPGALSVHSSADIVMRTNEHGQLIICCPPGTTVVNSQGLASDGVIHTITGVESSSSSSSIRSELSETAVASVSAHAAADDVESSITTWLDHGEGGANRPRTPFATASSTRDRVPTELTDGMGRTQSSRFVHRNTDLAQDYQAANGIVFKSQSQGEEHARLSGSGSSSFSSSVLPPVGQSLVSSSLSAALPLVSVDGGSTSASGSRLSASASRSSASESGSVTADSGALAYTDLCNNTFGSATSSTSSPASDLGTMQSTSAFDSDGVTSSSSLGIARAMDRVETSVAESSVISSRDSYVATSSDFSASLSSESATNHFTVELTEQSTTADDSKESLESSLEHSVSSPSLALPTGRSVHYLDPSVDDSRRVAVPESSASDRDVAGVASSNLQDTLTTAELTSAMQMVITHTLAAAYMQFSAAAAPRTDRLSNRDSAACRTYKSRTSMRSVLAATQRVSAIC